MAGALNAGGEKVAAVKDQAVRDEVWNAPATSADVTRAPAPDWERIGSDLDTLGRAVVPGLLDQGQCRAYVDAYDGDPHDVDAYGDGARYRSRVVMERHGFGRGEYQYFAYPLPGALQVLREQLYEPLARLANRWAAALGAEGGYPERHAEFIARCHAAGQTRPTPLILRYGEGDYNCLHQDVYGAHVFPLQVAVLLSRPGEEFSGGEFVLTEQRPRMQSRVDVVPLRQGDAVIFPVSQRPVAGARGSYRVNLRHGVSRLHSGQRYTLGIIFHDAA